MLYRRHMQGISKPPPSSYLHDGQLKLSSSEPAVLTLFTVGHQALGQLCPLEADSATQLNVGQLTALHLLVDPGLGELQQLRHVLGREQVQWVMLGGTVPVSFLH